MYFFQGNLEETNPANPVYLIIYIITERTGKRQEKIRKTDTDRKTKAHRNRKQKGDILMPYKKRSFGKKAITGKENSLYVF